MRLTLCLWAMAGSGLAFGADPPKGKPAEPISYYRQIRPILQQQCQGCHQPAKAQGKYIMTTFAQLLQPGESGQPPLKAGDPKGSNLFALITPQDGKRPEMPKGKEPLVDREVALIQQWIAQGAKDDSPASTRQEFDQNHPPKYAALPVINALDFSPDGSLLAVSGYHEVLLHQSDGSAVVGRLVGLSERIESVAFSPDGKALAVTGGAPGRFGEVQIWTVEKRNLRLSLTATFDTIYGASWSPDSSKVAFGCADNTVRAINSLTGERVLFQGAHNDWVLDTVFSTDASHLISVGRDMTMKLTEVATQRFVDNITSITPGALKGGLMAVDRHPKRDELLAGGADGVPKIYRAYRQQARVIGDDFNLIRAFAPLPGRIFAARFSKDGSRIVVGSSLDGKGEARVYQTDDAKLVATLAGQKGGVYAVAFHPEGKIVATGGFDGLVRLHDATTGRLLREFAPVAVTPTKAITQTR